MDTYVVAIDECVGEACVHAVVVNGHEHGVDDDAESDEEIDECVHDEQLHDAGEPAPETRDHVTHNHVTPDKTRGPRKTDPSPE